MGEETRMTPRPQSGFEPFSSLDAQSASNFKSNPLVIWRAKGGEPEGVRRFFLSKKVFLCFKKVLEGKKVSKKAS